MLPRRARKQAGSARIGPFLAGGLALILVWVLAGCAAPTGSATSAVSPAPTQTPVPAATQTRAPTATQTPALTATQTPVPTATQTPAPTATQAPMPSLARWLDAGQGGGGRLPASQSYLLAAELPAGPTQVPVYMQDEPIEWTASAAVQVAQRLGVQGQIYQSIGLAAAPRPGEQPAAGYLVVDGAQEVHFESGGIVRYVDRNRTRFFEGHWSAPESVPALADAVDAAERFLQPAGLLQSPYETAATGDRLLYYRLLDGRWPLVEPFAQVSLWEDGRVGEVQFWPLALERTAERPILSAQEAWELLNAHPTDERVWHSRYRFPEMPPWGEWRHANPPFWRRSYPVGQTVHRFGVPRVWFAVDEGGTPFLAMGDWVLTGNVQGLDEHALRQYAIEEWNYLHVWGTLEDAGDHRALRVQGWEPAQETYWLGTVRLWDGQAQLIGDDGQTVFVPDLPDGLPAGTKVSIAGGMHDDRLKWHLIQELRDAQPPPTLVGVLQMTVEQVDLVYVALTPQTFPPDLDAVPEYRIVQPVWRFRGHGDHQEAFEVYVQALR